MQSAFLTLYWISSISLRFAAIVSPRKPIVSVWKPIIANIAMRIRDWICPSPSPIAMSTRKRMPRIAAMSSPISPRDVKNASGRYITNERVITVAERFIYLHILEKSLEGRVSGFVLIGTEVIAILF